MAFEHLENEGQVFHKLSWVGRPLKHRAFSSCRFVACDFTKSDFTGTRFFDCHFQECNLSLVQIQGVRLQQVSFENCKLVGVNFTQIDPTFLSLSCKNCVLTTCNFSDLSLKGSSFEGSLVKDTYFTSCNLSGVNFEKTDLQGSLFHQTDLSRARFVGAINYHISPLNNKLSKALFSIPEVLSLLHHFDIIIKND